MAGVSDASHCFQNSFRGKLKMIFSFYHTILVYVIRITLSTNVDAGFTFFVLNQERPICSRIDSPTLQITVNTLLKHFFEVFYYKAADG